MASRDDNPWFKAKEVILDDFHGEAPTINASMDAAQVYHLEKYKEFFHAVRWERFRANYRNLQKGGFKKPTKKEPNYWLIAKPILHEYYVSKKITDETTVEELLKMEEFKNVPPGRLKPNFQNLKKRIKKDQGRAERDRLGYLRDMQQHTLAKDTDGEWHGSEAEALLRVDVENGQHKKKKPKFFQQEREEYKKFHSDIFRGHIYQETRRNKESAYWMVKKKKKQKKKLAKQQGKKYKDDDNDFYDPVLDYVDLKEWKANVVNFRL